MEQRRNGDGWWVTTFVIGVLALALGVIGVAIAAGQSGQRAAGAAEGAGGVTEFDVTLADISLTPSMIEVPAGEAITVHVTNNGKLDHDFKVMGTTGTAMLKAGETTDVVIGPFEIGRTHV